jgi:hypothetical protein
MRFRLRTLLIASLAIVLSVGFIAGWRRYHLDCIAKRHAAIEWLKSHEAEMNVGTPVIFGRDLSWRLRMFGETRGALEISLALPEDEINAKMDEICSLFPEATVSGVHITKHNRQEN